MGWKGSGYFNFGGNTKTYSSPKGDTVVTSGHSAIFPAGIPIGTVKNYYVPSGSNSFLVEVYLFADLSRINRAYIIRNKFWEEIQSLEEVE